MKDPSHLKRRLEYSAAIPGESKEAEDEVAAVADAKEGIRKANDGLAMFQLKPPGMKGMQLFEHMTGPSLI